MGKNAWDLEIPGQISIEDVPEMIGISRVFARARKQMTLAEYKTFIFCLCQIRWKDEMPPTIYLDKKKIAEILGFSPDPDHLSRDIKRSIGNLPLHSMIEFADEDAGIWDSGFLITRVTMLKNRVRVKFESEYLPLFSRLEKDFIMIWADDIFSMKSERTIALYEDLRLHSDSRQVCTRGYGVKALKELWKIPEDAYMRPRGGFNRSVFERSVLEPILEDLANAKMISLIRNPDGKLYRKVKQGGRVKGYELAWTISDRPRIASGEEAQELREKVERDPEVMKIAMDILKGQKRRREKGSGFVNYNQREIDYDAILKDLKNDAKEEN